jgi:hypothetical protein
MVAAILNGREKRRSLSILADRLEKVDYEKVFEIQTAILSLYWIWRTFDDDKPNQT